MDTTKIALQAITARINGAIARSGQYARDIVLVAVGKTVPTEVLRHAYEAGQRDFGESYVQEALEKMRALADLDLRWHFIGPLQSNKTRPVAEAFDWVHSVDRLKIAERLSAQRPAGKPPLNVLVQVNVSGEESKSGVAPHEAVELARAVAKLPHLRLRGLMTIPEPTNDEALRRQRFHTLAKLYDALRHEGLEVDTLSMGMSDDFETAIECGATMVRIGSALFGARPARGEDRT